MSKISSIYLSRKESDRMREVCEREGCTGYSLVKRVLLDHLWAYPLEKPPAPENEALEQDLGEKETMEVVEPEAAMEDAGGLSESVKRILEGKVDE